MSVNEPPERDEDILAALDFEPTVETTDVIDVSELTPVDLANLLEDTRQKLLDMGEMLSDLGETFGTPAGSPEARELHSLRLACLTEMRKRGML